MGFIKDNAAPLFVVDTTRTLADGSKMHPSTYLLLLFLVKVSNSLVSVPAYSLALISEGNEINWKACRSL